MTKRWLEEINDYGFIARLREGDSDAFQQLHSELRPIIYNFILKSFDIDCRDAEEIAADTLAKVHRSVARFDPNPGAKLTTWVFKIAKNTALDYIRKDAKRIQALPLDNDLSLRLGKESTQNMFREANLERTNYSSDIIPGGEDYRQIKLMRMENAFTSLRERDRNLILMKQEMEYEEIAAIENVSVGTVRTRYFRAIKRLQAAYKREG